MKHKPKLLVFLLITFPLLIILSTVDSLAGAQTGETAESLAESTSPVIIGVPHRKDFDFADLMADAFELALEAINKKGGINGRPLKLVYADDQGDPKVGQEIVKGLITKNKAVMLVGGYSSSNTVYMAQMAEKLDRPFLVCTAADDRITRRGWKNIYRLNPPAIGYAEGLEDFVSENIRPKSMAIVYENSPFGTGLALRMLWFCRENDIDVRRIVPYHKERLRPEYYRRILAPLKMEGEPPDVIYMVSYLNDAIAVLKEIRQLGLKSLLCGGAGGFTHPNFIKIAGDDANYVLTATLWYQEMQYPGTKEFYQQYMKRYEQRPDYHAVEAYSALLVAADALRRAESLSPESIRAALNDTNMATPFGPVKFTSYENFERQNRLPTQVLQIIEGKFESVWPRDIATAKFVPPPDWRKAENK
jgi:branched-chain amino acid transport system substrate-binding protein